MSSRDVVIGGLPAKAANVMHAHLARVWKSEDFTKKKPIVKGKTEVVFKIYEIITE